MEIVYLKKPDIPFPPMDCGLVLGNFDGVHRGHMALIQELKRLNSLRAERLPLGALCFTKPPSFYFDRHVPQLTSLEDKLALLRDAGLQFAVLYDFPDIMNMEADDFVRQVLIMKCQCRMAVCGYNYSFGRHGAGTAKDLARWLGTQPNRTVSVVDPVTDAGKPISSSLIRDMLERGHPEDATRLLGRPFFLKGTVKDGKKIGRALGFPTANLDFPPDLLIPARGVYAVTVRVGRRSFYGVANVGNRPTIAPGHPINCETFLFDFNGDLYGKEIRVHFLHFLREEKIFSSPAELQAQIEKDIKRAKEYF